MFLCVLFEELWLDGWDLFQDDSEHQFYNKSTCAQNVVMSTKEIDD